MQSSDDFRLRRFSSFGGHKGTRKCYSFFVIAFACANSYSPSISTVPVPSALAVPFPFSPLNLPVPPVKDHVPCLSYARRTMER